MGLQCSNTWNYLFAPRQRDGRDEATAECRGSRH